MEEEEFEEEEDLDEEDGDYILVGGIEIFIGFEILGGYVSIFYFDVFGIEFSMGGEFDFWK